MKKTKVQGGQLLMALSMSAAAIDAAAIEWNVGVEAGAEHHSNAAKSSQDEQDDLMQFLGAQVTAKGQSRTVELDLNYEALIEEWKDDIQGDRDTLTGYAQLSWRPVNFFRGYVNNQRHDLSVDSRGAEVSDNKDVRDTSEVGAEFSFNVSQVDTVALTGLYRQVRYDDDSGIDSERPGVLLTWAHQLSPVSTISLNGFAEQIEFDEDAPDIDRQSVYLGYQVTLEYLQYQVEAGYTRGEVDDEDNLFDDDTVDGPLFRAALKYDRGAHTVDLVAASLVTDSSLGLEEAGFSGGGDFNPDDTNLDQFDIVDQKQFFATYRWAFAPSWDFSAAYRFSQDDYKNLPEDEDRHDVMLGLDHRLTRTVMLGLYGGVETWEYKDDITGRDKDERYYTGLRADWQVGRQWSLRGAYEYEERKSDFAAAEYDNNIIYLSLRFVLR